MKQCPVIKNNLLRFIEGKDVNAIYDGYTFQTLVLGTNYATSFSHLHDFEAAPRNHWVPHYGIFARTYFNNIMKGELDSSIAYTNFKKNHGPPYNRWAQEFDELEHNEYLQTHGVAPEEVRHPAAQARVAEDIAPATTN